MIRMQFELRSRWKHRTVLVAEATSNPILQSFAGFLSIYRTQVSFFPDQLSSLFVLSEADRIEVEVESEDCVFEETVSAPAYSQTRL